MLHPIPQEPKASVSFEPNVTDILFYADLLPPMAFRCQQDQAVSTPNTRAGPAVSLLSSEGDTAKEEQ